MVTKQKCDTGQTIFEIKASHWSSNGQERDMTGSGILQPIIHILNVMTQLGNASLFYSVSPGSIPTRS